MSTVTPSTGPSRNDRDQTSAPTELTQKELDQVKRRRKKVFGKDHVQEGEISDAVGLALSGGGIRSASFNLGLLQAFIDRGLIRWVDYLSTVSGGGYIGSYLSTLLCHPNTKELNKRLLGARNKDGGEPEPVKHFILGGRYLQDGPMMSDRFLMGFLLNLAVWGSLLVLLTSMVAWGWRWLDCRSLIYGIGHVSPFIARWYTDWSRPFLVFGLFVLFWGASWPCTKILKRCDHRLERFALFLERLHPRLTRLVPRYDAARPLGKSLLKVAIFSLRRRDCGAAGD